MEDMRSRGASKPPLYPAYKSSITLPPLRMMFPSTLSKAFENSSYYMNVPSGEGSEAGKINFAIPPEKVVDLNIPPSLRINREGEGMNKNNIENNSGSFNENSTSQGVESGSSSKGKRIMSLDEAIEQEKNGRDIPLEVERKLRRTVSNRLSAQRSRLKRSQYIAELHNKIKELQESVAFLIPKVDSYTHRYAMLKKQTTVMEQQLKSCVNKSALCTREIEEKQAEIRRLKELIRAHKEDMMMSPVEPIAASSTSSLPFYQPENIYQMGFSSYPSFFQCEPQQRQAIVEVTTDQGGIEQYLNLDALTVSSPHATDHML